MRPWRSVRRQMMLDRGAASVARSRRVCIAAVQIAEIRKDFMGNRLTVGLPKSPYPSEITQSRDTIDPPKEAGSRRSAPRFVPRLSALFPHTPQGAGRLNRH